MRELHGYIKLKLIVQLRHSLLLLSIHKKYRLLSSMTICTMCVLHRLSAIYQREWLYIYYVVMNIVQIEYDSDVLHT
jgi:hypothetical protein